MTARQFWVQSEDYNARDDRIAIWPMTLPDVPVSNLDTYRALRNPGDFALGMTGPWTATVGRGWAYIAWAGSLYVLANDADEPIVFAPADATNGRRDLVVGRVYDSEAAGPDQPAAIVVLAGQPAAVPVPPAVPDGAVALHEVYYAPGSSAPVVTDRRPRDINWLKPRGFIGAGYGPPSSGTNIITPLTVTVPLVAGRRYKVSAFVSVSSPGGGAMRFNLSSSGSSAGPGVGCILNWLATVTGFGGNLVAGGAIQSSNWFIFTPATTGNQAFNITNTGTNNTNFAANSCGIVVEDIGGT